MLKSSLTSLVIVVAVACSVLAFGAIGGQAADASASSRAGLHARTAPKPPRVLPEAIRSSERARVPGRRKKGRAPRARSAMWYHSNLVFAEARCWSLGDLIGVDAPIVKSVSGTYQWVALQVNLINSQSGIHYGGWWYAQVVQWGDYVLQRGNWRFQNARTGETKWALSFLHPLQAGTNWVQVQVAWYSGNSVVRQANFTLHPDDYIGC